MWIGLWLGTLTLGAVHAAAGDVHLARVQDGVMEIALSGEVADWKTMPWQVQKVHGDDVWRVPMKGIFHGGVRIGERFKLREVRKGRSAGSCTVVSFVTRSVAYSDWAPEEATLPSCGTAQVYAQLDCRGKQHGLYLAVRQGVELTAFSPVPDEGTRARSGAKQALSTPAIMAEVQAAHSTILDQTAPMKIIYSQAALGNHPDLSVVDVHRYTGDGEVQCGGGDFSDKRWALWDGGRVVGPVHHDTPRPAALFTVGTQRYMVVPRLWDGWMITDVEGRQQAQMHDGFCGCPC
jgi:hypothetical protein